MEKTDSLKVVQKLQIYIEQQLQSPITLLDLAREAGYSPLAYRPYVQGSDRKKSV